MASAAILAGGSGRRFGGRDKGLLVFEGRTIRERQLAALSPISTDILVVGGAPLPDNDGPRVRYVSDRLPGQGPLGGLHTALLEARDDSLVVIACDMPFVSTALLTHLLSQAASKGDAVVPRTKRGYHPLCAVFDRRCLDAVERRLNAGKLAMLALLDDLRLRVVEEDEIGRLGDPDWLLANVNTADDYNRLSNQETHEP